MDLRLLLASLDDDFQASYLKDGIPLTKIQRAPQPGAIDPNSPPLNIHSLMDSLGSPHNLPAQRWGVIVPEQGGDELMARIAPLVELRVGEQATELLGDAPGQPFKVPPRMTLEQASQWIQDKLNPMTDAQRPRYLLILGSPDQVSIELQQALSGYYYVGRLAFDDPAGYGEYAKKAVDFSLPENFSSTPRALSYTVRSDSGLDAPDDGFDKLMTPMVASSQNPLARSPLPFQETSPPPGQATAQQFLQLARDPRPTILMSLSHGLGRSKSRPWSEEELRKFQGMMYFGGRRDPLRAEDVAKGDFLPGGVWFYFACFGAGTPAQSAYRHWLQAISPNLDVLRALPQNGSSFIAALPQAALANRRGPLAVMGHLDLAWSYSYDQKLSRHRGQAQRFVRLTQLAKRDGERQRIGPIFQGLLSDLPQVQTDLTSQYDGEAQASLLGVPASIDPRARANLWMLRQDLRAYILLGDPAAYLPLTPPPKPEPVSLGAIFSFEPTSAAAPATSASSVTLDKLVDTVLACIGEKKSIAVAASELGVSADELGRWVESYKNAGRAALQGQLGK